MRTRDPRLIAAFLTVAAAVLLSSSPARADAAAGAAIVAVDTAGHPDVVVTLDVPGGAAVGEWDVRVREAGVVRPARITDDQRSETEVVLVMDTSGSMVGGPMEAAKAAASSLVGRLADTTSIAIVGFGDQPYVVRPLTRDVAGLQEVIRALAASGETALYDALDLAVRQFSGEDVPRSIILASDGGDTASGTSLPTITNRLVDGRVRLFAVRLATDESNAQVLDGLAAATNGLAVDAAAEASALTATYGAIAASSPARVKVAYRSGADGSAPIRLVLTGGGIEHVVETSVELPAAAPVVPVTAATAAEAAPAQSVWPVVIGAGALFVALTLLLQLALVRRPRSLLAASRRTDGGRESIRNAKDAFGARVERALESNGRRQAVGTRLERAGMAVEPGEYVAMVLAATAFSGLCGSVVGGLGLGAVFAVLTVVVAAAILQVRASRRQAEVGEQLPDMLQQLTSSLRAGYGVMQSLDAVAREMGGPMAEEMRRVVAEVQLGRDLVESLDALATRSGGTDFAWVVQAIEINREVGGDLVEVLEAVAETIRAREQLQRQIKTLSAEGRLSSRILLAMPFVMALLISFMSPGYLAPLTQGAGPVVIAIGCLFMGAGWMWLRKIVRIEY
jgi:tight adherence protein B